MSLVDTVMLEHRTQYKEKGLNAFEHRITNAGAYQFFLDQNLIPNIEEEVKNKKAQAHAVKVPVIQDSDATITNVRSLTIADEAITSKLVTLSFATIRSAFQMTPTINWYNDINYKTELFRKLKRIEKSWLKHLDTLGAAQLNTNKAQYLAADGNPYPLIANELIVPYDNRELLFSEIDHIYKADELEDDIINIIGSTRLMPLFNQISEFGANNSQDKKLRIGNKQFYMSNQIASEANYPYVGYAASPDSVQFVNWNDFDALNKSKAYNGEVSVQKLPLVGLDVAVFYNVEFQDKSGAQAGAQRTKVEEWEFSTDICWVTAYNSAPTTKADPIVKFKIEKEGGIAP